MMQRQLVLSSSDSFGSLERLKKEIHSPNYADRGIRVSSRCQLWVRLSCKSYGKPELMQSVSTKGCFPSKFWRMLSSHHFGSPSSICCVDAITVPNSQVAPAPTELEYAVCPRRACQGSGTHLTREKRSKTGDSAFVGVRVWPRYPVLDMLLSRLHSQGHTSSGSLGKSIGTTKLGRERAYQRLCQAVIVFVVAINRPRTTPRSLLVVYNSIWITQCILLLNGRVAISLRVVSEALSLLLALFGIAISLVMPMRDPHLPTDGLGQCSKPPTASLRSPEDDLTLWQFMTVSWMWPLISIGSKRQLNDEDVWKLSWEFQHRKLHEKFRELSGTVVKRLLMANWFDLILSSLLALVEMIAGRSLLIQQASVVTDCCVDYSAPILLQQLLRSMERMETSRRPAVVYAVLTLAVRLIASQCAVFGLWFSRRCYERSRGEMITMLYEKTLSRKIISPSNTKVEKESDDAPNGYIAPENHEGGVWERVCSFLRIPFPSNSHAKKQTKPEQQKTPASMGKILNLMR